MRPTPIAEVVADTRVKIHGTIELAGETLLAPVSGRACIGYRARLYEREHVGWRCVAVEEKVAPFRVRDDSGTATVRARPEDLVWSKRDPRETGAWQGGEPTQRLLSFLERHKLAARGYFGGMRPFRFYEAALMPGELISVVGVAVREPDPQRGSTTRAVFDGASAPLFVLADETVSATER